jgi:cysteinyl-tRNA synthetase
LAYKYFLYTAHYRTPANLTWEGLFAAQTSLMRMYEKFISIMYVNKDNADTSFLGKYIDLILSSLTNDLNTASALANFVALFDYNDISSETKLETALQIDSILGLGFNEYYNLDKTLPPDVQTIADERLNARSLKDYTRSDELRELLNQRGYIVIDTKDSSIVATNPLK